MKEENKELTNLKAQAYDAIKQIEAWQAKLRELNIKINELENTSKK